MKNRFHKFRDTNQIIKPEQISGKKSAMSADHLTVIRFLIDKYALQGKKRLYASFFCIRKAFDSVDRSILFYTLLQKYQIGGNFLKLLGQMYENNQMYVKLSAGLTQPFNTALGLKQGCVLSPLIFNIFINDLPDHFNDHCDSVIINDTKVQALMFADDVMILSQSSEGLKKSIKITVDYFHDLNLSANFDKSQVMIINARGLLLDKDPDHQFHVHGQVLKVVREYNYLGVKLTTSNAASHGAAELFA